MATLGSSADIGYGITITWSGDTLNVISVDGPSLEVAIVDKTHSASASGWREKIAGLKDAGQLSAELNFVAAQGASFVIGEAGTLVVDFAGSETFTCSAILKSYQVSLPIEDRMTATAEWELTGVPVWA